MLRKPKRSKNEVVAPGEEEEEEVLLLYRERFYIFSQQIYLMIFLDLLNNLCLFLHKMSCIS
jgi:hypothetical protein